MFFNYDTKSYYGGIINIIDTYLKNQYLFDEKGFDISLINPKIPFSKVKAFSYVQKVFFLRKEKNYLKQHFHPQKDEILHLHSSRGWTLRNDLKLIKFVKEQYGIKICLSLHFAGISNILSSKFKTRKKQLDIINSCVDKVIVLSKNTLDELVGLGVDKSKLSLLYTFYPSNSNLLTKNTDNTYTNLLFVGSIDKRKGVLDLIEVLKTMEEFPIRCNICGGFSSLSMKKKFFKKIKHSKNINFLGYVKNEKKEEIFSKSDVLVLPSYGEGMPIVIMEALSYGCAVVSTRVGSICEIIEEENGILFDSGDKKALRNAILLLSGNKELLAKICRNNLKKSISFSLPKNVELLCDIYRSLE